MFGNYKTIIIAVVVLGVAFVIYAFFFKGTPQDDLLVSSAAQTPTALVSNEIIGALNQIESLKLSREIFDSAIYQSLKDRSQDIPPEPVGKQNPFDPISSRVPASRDSVPQIRDTPTTPTSKNIIKTSGPAPVI